MHASNAQFQFLDKKETFEELPQMQERIQEFLGPKANFKIFFYIFIVFFCVLRETKPHSPAYETPLF